MIKVLFLNHKAKECGVYQYGLRVGRILSKYSKLLFIYHEISGAHEYFDIVKLVEPTHIIYNCHGPTMPWLNSSITAANPHIIHIDIYHDGPYKTYGYQYIIDQDPDVADNDKIFSLPRPLLLGYQLSYPINNIPVINSFGFLNTHKGFEEVVQRVNQEFDQAIINIHTPYGYFGGLENHITRRNYNAFLKRVRSIINKPGIKFNSTINFMTDENILQFLANSSINIFLYNTGIFKHRLGISSVIDYALSVDRPLAISNSAMFRHIHTKTPSVCVQNNSIKNILEQGVTILDEYRIKWSNEKLAEKFDSIIYFTTKSNK